MGEEKVCNIFPKDDAARLHLTEKVLGLEEAEKFFNSIPENMRDYSVYSTLLTSYTRPEKTLDKAESTFKKMRELGFLFKPSPMISLYIQLGKLNMVDKLLYEMEENKVKPDNLTANNVLRAYADDVCDIKAMEMFLRMLDNDEQVFKLERDTINAMAKAYLRVCSEGKAKCKKPGKAKEEGYQTAILLLATLSLLILIFPPFLMIVPLVVLSVILLLVVGKQLLLA